MKHAAAREVAVNGDCAPDEVLPQAHADGRSFGPAKVPNGGLSLGVLHERADEIGARLTIVSVPGVGPTVTLDWQASDA